MGVRYAWTRHPKKYAVAQKTTSGLVVGALGSITSSTRSCYIYTFDGYNFDSLSGKFTPSGTISVIGYYSESEGLSENSLSVPAGKYFYWDTASSASNIDPVSDVIFKADASLSLSLGTYTWTGTDGEHTGYNLKASKSYTQLEKSAVADTSSSTTVSSAASTTYPEDGYSGNYWYILQGSDNVDPAAVNIPAAVKGHDGLPITVTPSDGVAYGGTILYRYFISLDNQATWTQISETAEASIVAAIPDGAASVAARVQALDDMGFVSTDYIVSDQTAAVTWNTAPVISGEDSDLGTFGLTPPAAISYTVTDVDGGAVNCTVTLDGAVVQEGEVVLGSANSYAITASQWLSMLNGAHKIVITADDEYGATAVRTYTFAKDVAELSITLAEPWITDGRVARMYILPVWSVPDGATVQVLATNNALDAEPVWQDVTDAVKLGKKFYFTNEVKTADQWAVNFKVLADRGTADQVYIKKLTGAFDGIGGT